MADEHPWLYYEDAAMYRCRCVYPCPGPFELLTREGTWRPCAGPGWRPCWLELREAFELALTKTGSEDLALKALDLKEPPPEPAHRRAPTALFRELWREVERDLYSAERRGGPAVGPPELWSELNRRLEEMGY